MEPNHTLDDEVAQMTDALLNGDNSFDSVDEEARRLHEVVRGLQELAAAPVPPILEGRIRQALDREWAAREAATHKDASQASSRPSSRMPRAQQRIRLSPVTRTLAFAAALVLALVAVVLLSAPERGGLALPGAAVTVGLPEGLLIVVTLALAAGALLFYWRNRR